MAWHFSCSVCLSGLSVNKDKIIGAANILLWATFASFLWSAQLEPHSWGQGVKALKAGITTSLFSSVFFLIRVCNASGNVYWKEPLNWYLQQHLLETGNVTTENFPVVQNQHNVSLFAVAFISWTNGLALYFALISHRSVLHISNIVVLGALFF